MKRSALYWILILIWLAPQVSAKNLTGVGFKTGYFGLPDPLLDLIMFEHPGVEGKFYGLEIRSFGPGGKGSMFSGLYSLEYSNMRGEGYWRVSQDESRIEGFGQVRQASFTATIIMTLFPSFPVRPYFGGGIGIGYIHLKSDATHIDELGTTVSESFDEKRIIPVGHLPVGVLFHPARNLELRVEGGFKNGFYFSGALVLIL